MLMSLYRFLCWCLSIGLYVRVRLLHIVLPFCVLGVHSSVRLFVVNGCLLFGLFLSPSVFIILHALNSDGLLKTLPTFWVSLANEKRPKPTIDYLSPRYACRPFEFLILLCLSSAPCQRFGPHTRVQTTSAHKSIHFFALCVLARGSCGSSTTMETMRPSFDTKADVTGTPELAGCNEQLVSLTKCSGQMPQIGLVDRCQVCEKFTARGILVEALFLWLKNAERECALRSNWRSASILGRTTWRHLTCADRLMSILTAPQGDEAEPRESTCP